MSSSGSKKQRVLKEVTPAEAVARLESAVTAALARVELLAGEIVRMNEQGEELEELLKGVASGESGPREMIAKLHILEEENRDLRRRLAEGREGVDRLLSQVRFLEEQA